VAADSAAKKKKEADETAAHAAELKRIATETGAATSHALGDETNAARDKVAADSAAKKKKEADETAVHAAELKRIATETGAVTSHALDAETEQMRESLRD